MGTEKFHEVYITLQKVAEHFTVKLGFGSMSQFLLCSSAALETKVPVQGYVLSL